MCSRFLPLVLVVASMVPRLTIAADLVDEFSSISKRIPFLNPGSAIYHVPSTGEFHNHLPLSPDERKALDSIYHLSNAASASEIAVALKHDDPKIRAMAVVALARTTEPYEFIPRLMSLVGDHGKTFPSLDLGSLPSNLFSNDTEARGVMRWVDQTVGGFATAIVSEYMRLAGDHYEFEHEEETTATADADFLNLYNQYWEKRKGRRHCLSWTWVKLTRAWHLAGAAKQQGTQDGGKERFGHGRNRTIGTAFIARKAVRWLMRRWRCGHPA